MDSLYPILRLSQYDLKLLNNGQAIATAYSLSDEVHMVTLKPPEKK